MKSEIIRKEDGTIQLNITIPLESVKKTWKQVIDTMAQGANLPGFRKGKAPKKLVEEKLDPSVIREEVLKKLLPEFYIEALKEHNLKPIISPRVHVEKADDPNNKDASDWKFSASTCEQPIIKLGDYKKKIADITAKTKIVIPGKDPFDPAQGKEKPVAFEEIAGVLLENVTAQVPHVLKEGEIDRLLSQLLDDIKSLGLTLDQYLTSTGKNPQILRAEYEKKVENDIKLEFTLQKIAEEERITVDEKEIEEAILKAKDEKEKQHLQSNRYLLASILRQQKTLDFLKSL